MQDPENPYAASAEAEPARPIDLQPNNLGLVSHLQVVGILQIVLGVLELCMGGFLSLIVSLAATEELDNGAFDGETLVGVGMMVGLGVVVLVSGVLRLVTGVATFSFRLRWLTIASLMLGFASVFTCYCSVFSSGLGINSNCVRMTGGPGKRLLTSRISSSP